MAELNQVLERLAIDGEFAASVVADPMVALAPYDLTTQELRVLAEHLDGDRAQGSGFAALFESTE